MGPFLLMRPLGARPLLTPILQRGGRAGDSGGSRSRAAMELSTGGALSSLGKNESYLCANKVDLESLDIQLDNRR
jgi:hypothetical protein